MFRILELTVLVFHTLYDYEFWYELLLRLSRVKLEQKTRLIVKVQKSKNKQINGAEVSYKYYLPCN